jgi:hypothetical protein
MTCTSSAATSGGNELLGKAVQLGFNRKYELFCMKPGYGRRQLGFGAVATPATAPAPSTATRMTATCNLRQG